jgi:hypothetical protein
VGFKNLKNIKAFDEGPGAEPRTASGLRRGKNMEQLRLLMSNRILWTGIFSWAVAQILKALIHAAVYKTFRLERLFGDGGMPSAHSATVTSMATATAVLYGLDSFQFAVTAMLAIIVMHDACGVRLETGKQSKILNELMDMFTNSGQKPVWSEKRLKEFVGHTPLQVAAGFVLGVIMGLLMTLL